MIRFRVASLFVLAFGLLATSCTKPEIKKAEYIEKMDAICKNAVKEIVSGFEVPSQDPEKNAAAMDRVLALQNKMFSDLEKVPRPTQDATVLEEFFSASRVMQGVNAKLMEYAKRNLKVSPDPKSPEFQQAQQEGMRISTDMAAAIEKASSAAQKYGFKECGKVGSGVDR